MASLPFGGDEHLDRSNEAVNWSQVVTEMQFSTSEAWDHFDDLKYERLLENEYTSDEFDPNIELSSDRFEIWCDLHGIDSRHWDAAYEFLRGWPLKKSRLDPYGYPGMAHALHMVNAGCRSFEELDPVEQAKIEFNLNRIYADIHTGQLFDVGQIVGDRWKILSRLSDAVGFFNRGVHLVSDLSTRCRTPYLMKILPSSAMYPGYADREADILLQLHGHPNIVQFRGGYVPNHPHAAPWVIMEFCNAGTLQKCMNSVVSLPVLFIWHVFESLVEAVRYSHTGPVNGFSALWDPVSHRDIIPGNILLHRAEDSKQMYPVVKLADWGCAVTQSEANAKGLSGADLPEQAASCIPPEGTMGSEAADIYQVGLIIRDLLAMRACLVGSIPCTLREDGDLGTFVEDCTTLPAYQRPRAAVLLDGLQGRRAYLMECGYLTYEPLIL